MFILYPALAIIVCELCILVIANSTYAHNFMSILHPALEIIGGELCILACYDNNHPDNSFSTALAIIGSELFIQSYW